MKYVSHAIMIFTAYPPESEGIEVIRYSSESNPISSIVFGKGSGYAKLVKQVPTITTFSTSEWSTFFVFLDLFSLYICNLILVLLDRSGWD